MNRNPTRAELAAFQAKATVFRAIRFCRDLASAPRACAQIAPNRNGASDTPLAESRSALWDPEAPHGERVLQAGKVQNLRVASRCLDGVQISPGEEFSFWKQVGPPIRWRGYVRGRELRQGCLIPTVGGGLCQLSNALYDCALQAGFSIEERHAHTQVVPGSLAETGRDATVFWNYVDLRFRTAPRVELRIDLTADELIVQIRSRS